ncbi:MAG: TetR/AcrR family transcriptional regulator C-terminal domain-containing protein [Actinomycetota bacterium]|nr:TetR/AcrR family transcriptional regulator C-terminal domain-containing protein [Actinomycetota bacterium]
MAARTDTDAEPRIPLRKDRVLAAAIALADESGIESLTMRRLAHELGVEAMSLYYHVANKEEVLDGMVDVLLSEINAEVSAIEAGTDWKAAMRRRILAARQVLLRHRWAPGVIESRVNMGEGVVRYFDTLLGLFRAGGFSYDLAHHALHALGSRALGFTQELFDPADDAGEDDAMAMLEQMADQLPNLVGMMMEISHDDPESTLGWCDDQTEFEFGLDLILDGLDALRPKA